MSTPTVEIKISSTYPPGQQGGIRAYAYATIDGCIGIRGIKVVEGGRDGLFVSMPSRKTVDGYKDICFPVTAEFREQLHKAVLDAYQQKIVMAQESPVQREMEESGVSQEAAGGEGISQESPQEAAGEETLRENPQEADGGETVLQESPQMAGM